MTYQLVNPHTCVSRAEFDTLEEMHEFVRKDYPDSDVEFREGDTIGRVERVFVDGTLIGAIDVPIEREPPEYYPEP